MLTQKVGGNNVHTLHQFYIRSINRHDIDLHSGKRKGITMTKEFWRAALIRAIKTVCQTAIATIGTAMVITDVNWTYVLSASALSGILSILTSLSVGLPEVQLQQTLYDLDNIADDEYAEEYHALEESEAEEDE